MTSGYRSRLSGLDATFVYAETRRARMHTLKLFVLDPRSMTGGYAYDRLFAGLRVAIGRLPAWSCKLSRVPGDLDHPSWVTDERFELGEHVHRVVLTPPGTRASLDALVADVLSTPLPEGRPLWNVTVVEGLESGRIALLFKLHHALADGIAFSRITEAITTTSPSRELQPVKTRSAGEPRQSPSQRALAGLARWAIRVVTVPILLVRSVAALARRWRQRRRSATSAGLLFRGPRAPFGGPLVEARSYARTTVHLDDIKRVKDHFGTKVNDVVLALVADTVRQYLLREGFNGGRPLVAGIPASAEGDADSRRCIGNVIAHLPTSLHNDIDDPVDRLLAIHETTAAAKAELEAAGRDLLMRWSELTRPGVMRAMWRLMPHLPRPPINLVVSNVPGPREPRYLAGAEITELASVGPLLEGIGLNITVWSYCDRMTFSMSSTPRHDVRVLADGIAPALERLCARVAEEAA